MAMSRLQKTIASNAANVYHVGGFQAGGIAMIGRREFLRSGLVSAGCVLAAKASLPFVWAQSKSVDSRIEVLTGEPLGIISPNLYGLFAENLSGVIYDGIWVGPNSKVPNVDGIR